MSADGWTVFAAWAAWAQAIGVFVAIIYSGRALSRKPLNRAGLGPHRRVLSFWHLRPRYALHPSQQHPEGLPDPRDFEQARSVARLVRENMPQLSFESTLTSLHGDVPERNSRHLMLDQDVVDAVSAGLFHIYTMSDGTEGLALISGMECGGV